MRNAQMPCSELRGRAAVAIRGFAPSAESLAERTARFADIAPPDRNADGATEGLDSMTFTHRHVEAAADVIVPHYVECGTGEPVVFLHGLPDPWRARRKPRTPRQLPDI